MQYFRKTELLFTGKHNQTSSGMQLKLEVSQSFNLVEDPFFENRKILPDFGLKQEKHIDALRPFPF
jgi:hypothetical protein